MAGEVRFPEMRARVIAAVEKLAEPYQPDATALVGLPSGASQFGLVFDLLYEDVDLRHEPESAVGTFLKSSAEAQALSGLTAVLVRVLEEAEDYANDRAYPTDEEFQRAPSWSTLVDAARSARETLLS